MPEKYRLVLNFLHWTRGRCLSRCMSGFSQHQQFLKQSDGSMYEGHRKTSFFQKSLLAAGSAVIGLINPTRSDMIATLGETTGYYALRGMHLQMLNDPTGRRILMEKPIIDGSVLNLPKLRHYPDGSLGKEYGTFMEQNNISSDSRDLVHYVDHTELAYVMKRYRQIHDFVHLLVGMPSITVPGELAVKWFELAHFGLPMTALSAFFGHLAVFGPLAVTFEQRTLVRELIPWALYNGAKCKFLLNVYFEQELEKDMSILRQELRLEPAPFIL